MELSSKEVQMRNRLTVFLSILLRVFNNSTGLRGIATAFSPPTPAPSPPPSPKSAQTPGPYWMPWPRPWIVTAPRLRALSGGAHAMAGALGAHAIGKGARTREKRAG